MQKIGEFFLVAFFAVGTCGPSDAQPRLFQHAHDVIRRSFPRHAELRDELPPNLLDFRRSKARLRERVCGFEDQRLFVGGFAPNILARWASSGHSNLSAPLSFLPLPPPLDRLPTSAASAPRCDCA